MQGNESISAVKMYKTTCEYKAIPLPLTEYFIIKCPHHGILGIYTTDPDKVHKTHEIEIPHSRLYGVTVKYYFYEEFGDDFLVHMN